MQRNCPVCHNTPEKSKLFLKENFDKARLTEYSFASRKLPEYMCHRLLKCNHCDVVYASSPADIDKIEESYHLAGFDSAIEAEDASLSYISAIQHTLSRLPERRSALEIGTGSGVFLDNLKVAGFSDLVGIEPSTAAIAAAPEYRKGWIKVGMFCDSDFAPQSFDLICCFMTLEHVIDPVSLVRSSLKLLKPGGAFVAITHNYRSLVNRALGSKSPIIDIEHLQLFSPESIRYMMSESGYSAIELRDFANTYSLAYWVRLTPLPMFVKYRILSLLNKTAAGKIKLTFNVGNMIVTGFNPASTTKVLA